MLFTSYQTGSHKPWHIGNSVWDSKANCRMERRNVCNGKEPCYKSILSSILLFYGISMLALLTKNPCLAAWYSQRVQASSHLIRREMYNDDEWKLRKIGRWVQYMDILCDLYENEREPQRGRQPVLRDSQRRPPALLPPRSARDPTRCSPGSGFQSASSKKIASMQLDSIMTVDVKLLFTFLTVRVERSCRLLAWSVSQEAAMQTSHCNCGWNPNYFQASHCNCGWNPFLFQL